MDHCSKYCQFQRIPRLPCALFGRHLTPFSHHGENVKKTRLTPVIISNDNSRMLCQSFNVWNLTMQKINSQELLAITKNCNEVFLHRSQRHSHNSNKQPYSRQDSLIEWARVSTCLGNCGEESDYLRPIMCILVKAKFKFYFGSELPSEVCMSRVTRDIIFSSLVMDPIIDTRRLWGKSYLRREPLIFMLYSQQSDRCVRRLLHSALRISV
jgi:hypothetical protein